MAPLKWLLPVALLVAACGPNPGEFGSACAKDDDCTTGKCVTALPGGYCSADCGGGGACPDGSQCAPVGGGNFCLQTCTQDFDCRDGYVCAEAGEGSICKPKCTADADCANNGVCGADGHCANGKGKVGATCNENAACETARCEAKMEGGYCSKLCSMQGEGASGNDCPAPSICARAGEAQGLCFAPCQADTDCRANYYCDLSAGKPGVCRAKCKVNDDCGVGYSCIPSSGTCQEGAAAPRKVGATCGAGKTCTSTDSSACDADCDTGYCLTQQTEDFPGGTCSDDCSAQGFVCPDNGVCILAGTTSVCLQTCSTNFDCRSPYFCAAVAGGGGKSVCIPRCTAVPLCDTATEECDQFSGACVKKGTAGTGTVSRVDVGSVSVSKAGDQANATSTVEFDVPADAVSFSLVLQMPFGGSGNLYKLTSPGGQELFNYSNYATSAVRTFQSDGALAVLYPNSPRLSIQPGKYKASFIVFNTNGGNAPVSVVIKRSSAPAVGSGKMNLNMWFVGVDVNASTAPTDANFQTMLTEFKRLYAQAGITVGDVKYLDAPAASAASLSIIDSVDGENSELRQLFRLSAGAPNDYMNYFFVKEIREDRSGGYITIGMAGGIPGVPVIQGTSTSGVAASTLDLKQAPKRMASLMAHEGAHWLGLFHTTEANGKFFDQLSDTPECPASKDANGNGMMDANECSSAGTDNVMFWVLTNNEKFTPNQGFVLLHSPAIR